jgi:short subunit fatty acids transporter
MKSFKGGGENCIHLVIIVLLVVIIAMLMMHGSKNSRYEHFFAYEASKRNCSSSKQNQCPPDKPKCQISGNSKGLCTT